MPETPEVKVVIEIPCGSFLKRRSTGHVDFISPLPCPYNYGSVPTLVALEGDLLDAVVLWPRLAVGTRVRVPAWGAISQMDRGMVDNKLICSVEPLGEDARRAVLRSFRSCAWSKGLLNIVRGRRGRNAWDEWTQKQEGALRRLNV
jgi:inorganic pyrophosphatase